MKTFIMLTTVLLAIACSSPGSRANAQSSSQIKARDTRVGVGGVAPDFTLLDQNGNQVMLSEARSKSPVVLVFYRGYW
jgi:cytochrome oxidase Cu insertion factor (SCO1/SenC/PrrC family)